jgi:REP element-mobilizing transposase RayT
MPRPVRIEYKNAYYHVMNRGRRRRSIFPSAPYSHAFLDTLAEAHERFGLVIHGYCLLGNHYHLLLQTPHGNLGRAMHHINGVYTQRYNRLKRTDGPLFRGRYQAILVDKDSYLLPLSCYIHRNPVETTPPLVNSLATYRWSSYATYINHTKEPKWLYREGIYEMLGQHQKYQGYRTYVEAGVDDEIKEFYDRGHTAAVIGDQAFITWVRERKLQEVEDKVMVAQVLPGTLSIARIIRLVADYYKVEAAVLTAVVKGPKKGFLARKVAMYMCQQLGGYRLAAIMRQFGLTNIGSVSFITTQIRKRIKENKEFSHAIQRVKRYIIKHAY